MKKLKLFQRDLSLGTCRNVVLFVLPVILAIVQCVDCHDLILHLNEENQMRTGGTILDYYIQCTKGMSVFIFDSKSYFIIPLYWFVFQIGISYCIGNYAYDDFMHNGRNLLLAIKNRKSWWDSKCLWCISTVLVYYTVYILAIVMFALIFGADLKLDCTSDFVSSVFGYGMTYMKNTEVILISLVLPCVTTISLCMLQILIGFFTTPVVALASICGVYVLSAYYTKWFMLGNYTMWLRSTYLTEDGVHHISGLILAVTLFVCVWNVGSVYFERKDIF